METRPSNILSLFSSLATLVGFFLIHRIFKFYSSFQSFLQSQLDFILSKSSVWEERKNPDGELSLNKKICCSEKEDDDDEKLCRGDMEIVMENLGIFCSQDDEKLQEKLGLDELSVMFEEKEPSLEEVKEAFDVFDENKDGFIDASELQRVFCCLGFNEGLKVEECKKMIRVFDVNGDERIDFSEFVKFMENIFC